MSTSAPLRTVTNSLARRRCASWRVAACPAPEDARMFLPAVASERTHHYRRHACRGSLSQHRSRCSGVAPGKDHFACGGLIAGGQMSPRFIQSEDYGCSG